MTREHYMELLQALDRAVLELGEVVVETMEGCMRALQEKDTEAAVGLIQGDADIDRRRQQIEHDCVVIMATQQPAAGDLRRLTSVLSISTELERIGDYCEGIAKLTLRMAGEPVIQPFDEIQNMAERTAQVLREALQAYGCRDMHRARHVWQDDDEVDVLYEQVFRDLLAAMVADASVVRRGTYLLWVAHNLERIADRATNIMESLAFMVTGDVEAFRLEAASEMPAR